MQMLFRLSSRLTQQVSPSSPPSQRTAKILDVVNATSMTRSGKAKLTSFASLVLCLRHEYFRHSLTSSEQSSYLHCPKCARIRSRADGAWYGGCFSWREASAFPHAAPQKETNGCEAERNVSFHSRLPLGEGLTGGWRE